VGIQEKLIFFHLITNKYLSALPEGIFVKKIIKNKKTFYNTKSIVHLM